MHLHFKNLITHIAVILCLLFLSTQTDCFAQQNFTIFEDPVGSGGSTNQQQDSGVDNTFIYVVGGAIIVGIIAYTLLTKKDKEKTDADTTAVLGSSPVLSSMQNTFTNKPDLPEAKLLPVDIFFGVRNDAALLRSKTYMLGISVEL